MKSLLIVLVLAIARAGFAQTPANQWTYVPVAGTSCGDPGTTTGYSVYPTADTKHLLIYFQGGGYCYDYNTCFNMRVGSTAPGFRQLVSNLDGMKQTNPDPNITIVRSNNVADGNPFTGWSKVFISYCTGDLGMGSQTATYTDPWGGKHIVNHMGYSNVSKFLTRLTATFAPSQIVVAGTSAGGFAAMWNADQIARAFHGADAQMQVIDDAGPYMHEPYWAPGLQTKMATAWVGSTGALPPSCVATSGNCNPAMGGHFHNIIGDLATAYPHMRVALTTGMADNSISWAFSRLTFGAPDNAPPFAAGPCGSATAGDCLPDGMPGLQVQPGARLHGYFCNGMLPSYVANQPAGFKTFAVMTRQTTTVGTLSPNTHGLLVTWPPNQVRADDGTTLAAFLGAELSGGSAWTDHAFAMAQAPAACAGWSF